MREPESSALRNEITANPWVWAALALCAGLLLAAVYVPPLAYVLRLADPGIEGWTIALGMSLLPLAVGQAAVALRRR